MAAAGSRARAAAYSSRPRSAPQTPGGQLPAYMNLLNAPQKEAALHTEGPLIVLAGAGSGKTRMLTSRIAHLIDVHRVVPYNILAVTFTNKAAREMKERVERALEEGGVEVGWGHPEIGTFHSVCVRILRKEMKALSFTKPFVIYDDSDQLSLIKSVMKKLNIDQKSFNPKSFRSQINTLKCDAITPEEFEPSRFNQFEKKLKVVFEQYQKDLYANNALDFGEILVATYQLLKNHPSIRESYQRRFRYIHVDEYQDTNRVQYLLLSLLASPKHGGHANICVVGDEDQSIYKWRGADIRNILDFEKEYPNAKVIKLEQNYRSTQNIITAAGHVISNNSERKDKRLWTDNDSGVPVVRFQVPDEKSEAETVISEIKKLVLEGMSLDDMAIFYRTHAQSRQFEDVFRREKIVYQVVGGVRFYDRREIKDILSYLKLILNPSDSVSLKRVINTPARGIGKTTIDKLDSMLLNISGMEQEEQAADLWSVLGDVSAGRSPFTGRTAQKLADFHTMMSRFMREQPQLLLSELYHLILDETGYVRQLKKENTVESLARVENLEELDNLIQEFEDDVFDGLADEEREKVRPELLNRFIEQSTLVSETDQEFHPSSVKMMTLHASKGLEFPVVFMVGMEEGLLPSVRPWEETPPEEIEEERRLCYVGMTRARQRLYLSNALARRVYGTFSFQEPGRFLSEIPYELIELRDLAYAQKKKRELGGGSGVGTGFSASAERQKLRSSSSSEVDWETSSSKEWIGQTMNHPQYGAGRVLSIEGSGASEKVVVEFQGRVRRKFMVKFLMKLIHGAD